LVSEINVFEQLRRIRCPQGHLSAAKEPGGCRCGHPMRRGVLRGR
jgi:hypothetical protein